jgi:N-acyl-D-amino-acid deacylase
MKKYTLIIGILISLAAFKYATNKNIRPEEINKAVNKSLPLLQSSSHTFLKNAEVCHSCHHQSLGVLTFSLAKEKGFAVNNPLLQEALDSTMNFWSARKGDLAENNDVTSGAVVMEGAYDLWALSANQYKADKTIELLAKNIMQRQTNEGSWVSPNPRPPLEYYSFTATALILKGIQSYAPATLKTEALQRVQRARAWLTKNIPQNNEEKVFQLLGLTWANADKKLIKQQADKLVAAQHEDGGWSQLDSLPTDAYATGQSLFALNQSGQLSTNDPPYQKGVSFLLRTQFNDGSWKVQTRSYSMIPYVSSGFPHGNNQFISAAGSNWATMALLLAAK